MASRRRMKDFEIWWADGRFEAGQSITDAAPSMTKISLGYHPDLRIYGRASMAAVRYRDEVLDLIVKLYVAAVDPSFVLVDDNVRFHKAAIIEDFLENERITCM
ncbi:DDE_3 domain-containing protein [Trichonephila clavipes]|nr:DDE_3 domain-containing protein [Trichonephila clavipes]